MLFNSANFIIFFIIVLFLYYILPHRVRWIMLLIASLYFYMCWEPALILLILFSSAANYLISNSMRKKEQRVKKRLLILSIVINFGMLFIFKYLVFASELLNCVFGVLGAEYPIREFNIILPMGISFYTFQAAGYTFDVYRGEIEPQKNWFKFTLFITFFPQLVAGPIERAKNLMGQLFERHFYNVKNIESGLKLMMIGYFKKIVVADRAAVVVDNVYSNAEQFNGISLIIATMLFAVQVYCDFSGYSDIARGAAKTMGIDLTVNFDRPFFAENMKDFWRRWHISLSGWFKDYIYIPMGGSRVSRPRWMFNIMTMFVVSGLWHGANLTFVLWGAINGIYEIIGYYKHKLYKFTGIEGKIPKFFSRMAVFCLFSFSLIFFRANNLEDGFYTALHLFDGVAGLGNIQYIYETILGFGVGMFNLCVIGASIALLFLMEGLSFKGSIVETADSLPFVFRFAFYVFLGIFILGTGVFDSGTAFIYFQF